MTFSHSLRSFLSLAIGCVIFAVVLHTWMVMGLVEPVVVSGSSMAPGIKGEHLAISCHQCNREVDFGVDYFDSRSAFHCSHCGAAGSLSSPLPLHRGDRLLIDRSAYLRREPKRWEVVVLRNPDTKNGLSVKRIVGLPGETLQIREGNLWIDGAILKKPIVHQRSLRLPIRIDGKPITDAIDYNMGLSRELEYLHDFMITASLHIPAEGWVILGINDGNSKHQVKLSMSDGVIGLFENEVHSKDFQLNGATIERIQRGQVRVEFSNFDRQLLFAIEEKELFRLPLATDASAVGVVHPFQVETSDSSVKLEDVQYFRDVYWTQHPVGTVSPGSMTYQLGENEFFLLGDNSPISLDSRIWGPVPREMLLGRVVFAR